MGIMSLCQPEWAHALDLAWQRAPQSYVPWKILRRAHTSPALALQHFLSQAGSLRRAPGGFQCHGAIGGSL